LVRATHVLHFFPCLFFEICYDGVPEQKVPTWSLAFSPKVTQFTRSGDLLPPREHFCFIALTTFEPPRPLFYCPFSSHPALVAGFSFDRVPNCLLLPGSTFALRQVLVRVLCAPFFSCLFTVAGLMTLVLPSPSLSRSRGVPPLCPIFL